MRTFLILTLIFVISTLATAQEQTSGTANKANSDNQATTSSANTKADQTTAQDTPAEPPVEISEELRKDILTLLDLNKELSNRYASVFNMFAGYKMRVPGVKKEFWDECDKLLDRDAIGEIMIVQYAKIYSHEDIKDLIAFYNTRVGKKYIRSKTQINRLMYDPMNEFTKAFFDKVTKKLDEAGYVR